MAQSAFAAGGGNAKMAQLKKLQANRNMSAAQLRRLVEQIGNRNLNANKPQRPRQGQGSRRPQRGTGATNTATESKSKIDYSKYDVDREAPKGPNRIKPMASKGSGNGGSGGGKPKTDKNAAYKAARDKIAKAQGKDAKAKATTNAEIVGLKAFIKAHKDKKGMAKAVAAARAKLAKKQGSSTKPTSSKPFGSGATYASSKVKTNSNMA